MVQQLDEDIETTGHSKDATTTVTSQHSADHHRSIDDIPGSKHKAPTTTRITRCRRRWYDHDSFVFASRVATSVTLASLFVLAFDDDNPWPQGVWVSISAGIVAWQISPDRASVAKKMMERIAGTLLGASLGLAVGLVSHTSLDDDAALRLVLGVSVAVVGLTYSYLASTWGYRSSYAAILGNFTFGVVVLAFYMDEEPWKAGVYRVINIGIGCCIAALSAMILWPISTMHLIQQEVHNQVLSAGMSAKRVLEASVQVSEHHVQLASLAELVREKSPVVDAAHDTYVKSVDHWKACRSMLTTAKYDPFYYAIPKDRREAFLEQARLMLAISFRMDTNVIMLDTVLRSGVHRGRYSDPVEVLRDVGIRIERVLDLSANNSKDREQAAAELLDQDLVRIRSHLADLRSNHGSYDPELDVTDLRRELSISDSMHLAKLESPGQSALFYRLVEQLILQTVRLHFYAVGFSALLSKERSLDKHEPIH